MIGIVVQGYENLVYLLKFISEVMWVEPKETDANLRALFVEQLVYPKTVREAQLFHVQVEVLVTPRR